MPVRPGGDMGAIFSRNAGKRENILKAVRFEQPDYIPVEFHINEAAWNWLPNRSLNQLVESHDFLFPRSEPGSGRVEFDYSILERPGKPFTDGWGCVWETTVDGIVGTVTKHPLATWDAIDDFEAPDPDSDSGKGPIDWTSTAEILHRRRQSGMLTMGGLRHGHTFQTLADIRGYENLLFDMFDREPNLTRLIEIVERFNLAIVNRYLECGAEWMSYPDDLGMQNGPMISPDLFERYIKPVYARLIEPAREKGCIIHTHSDGDIRTLAGHLTDVGFDAINLQDTVNGVDWIKENLAGKVCIDLDIDRSGITRLGKPAEIDAYIRSLVETLGSREGGLMMIYGLYPGIPLENAKAVMDAMEKYAFHYSG